MNRRPASDRRTFDRARETSALQNELRRELASKLDQLRTQTEQLFTRSVEFRYSAIRQRRRAAVAALLAPTTQRKQRPRRS